MRLQITLPKRKSPLEKEWTALQKKEQAFLEKRVSKKDSLLSKKLEQKVPDKLQATLDAAFEKAFSLVFEKGTGLIEKTYDAEQIRKEQSIRQFTAEVKQDRKSLQAFSRHAGISGTKNLLLSAASGIGLGALGIGIPDIVLFTGMLLKNIYEIALQYGYDYGTNEEKLFILLLIQGAVSYGEPLLEINQLLDHYSKEAAFPKTIPLQQQVQATAGALSQELLYLKFLQGIPIIGVIGGAYDAIYMNRITEYAQLKYKKRLLTDLLSRQSTKTKN